MGTAADKDGITPGRTAHVLFTPAASFDGLVNNTPGWFRSNSEGIGRVPDQTA